MKKQCISTPSCGHSAPPSVAAPVKFPSGGRKERKKERKENWFMEREKNKGVTLVSSDKLLNLGQPSQREIHTLISAT